MIRHSRMRLLIKVWSLNCSSVRTYTTQHELFVLESVDKEPDVLFVGDSHIALLEQSEVYHNLFAPLHCLCFGIMNDTTQRLVWRLENGELDDIKPKIIVISSGTFDRNTADDTYTHFAKVVKLVRSKQPNAHLFILVGLDNPLFKEKLLPIGRRHNKRREFVNQVNEKLCKLGEGDNLVHLLNIDAGFVGTDGTIDHHDMFDYCHLSKEGYRKAFDLVFTAVHSVLSPDI